MHAMVYTCICVCVYIHAKVLMSNIYNCDHMWFPNMNLPEQTLKNMVKL